ncbi:MAG: hypothetical protein JOZ19_12190 [Rubrobacter sp.]|nr:hypothetical protein [Rubrobacter sp.]
MDVFTSDLTWFHIRNFPKGDIFSVGIKKPTFMIGSHCGFFSSFSRIVVWQCEPTFVIVFRKPTFFKTLIEGQVACHPLDVFIAGDGEEAKGTVA